MVEGSAEDQGLSTFTPRDLGDLDLPALLGAVLAAHAEGVAAWRRDTPGSWGALAAQAILATRRALGRRLTEEERRIVWRELWATLVAGEGAR